MKSGAAWRALPFVGPPEITEMFPWTRLRDAGLRARRTALAAGHPVYFVLGGVCVYEAQVEWFSREMARFQAANGAQASFRPAVPLHTGRNCPQALSTAT